MALLSGCGGSIEPWTEWETPEISPLGGGPGGNEPGPISTNGLLPSLLEGAHRTNLIALSQDSLSGAAIDQLQLGAQAKYIAACALAPGQSITIGAIAYPGALGLAPGWTSKPLILTEQRWITACLLAHVNASGESMNILVAGNRPELHTLGGEGDYTFEEAAFYGNLFDADDAVPPGATLPMASDNNFACAGRSLSPNAMAAIHARICTDPLNCAISIPGACVDGSAGWDSCVSEECYATSFPASNPPSHPGMEEVITIYLSSADQCKIYGCPQ